MMEDNLNTLVRHILKPKVVDKNGVRMSNNDHGLVDRHGQPLKKCQQQKDAIITRSEQDKWVVTDIKNLGSRPSEISRRDFLHNSILLMCGSLLPIPGNSALASEQSMLFESNILQRNMLGFHGERMDPSTGLYPLGQGYRWYNPVLRRFCQYDRNASPFGVGGGNGYAFAMNNPIGITDPSGHGIIAAIIAFISSVIASVSSAISTAAGAVTGAVSYAGSIAGAYAASASYLAGATGATAASVGSFTAIATKAIIYTGVASGLTEGFRASAGAIALASGASDETAQLAENITYNIFAAAFFFTAALLPISSTATTAVKVAGQLGRAAGSLGVTSQIVSATGGGIGSSNSLTASKLTQAALWLGAIADTLVLASSPLASLKVAKSRGKYNLESMKTSYTYRVKLKTNSNKKQSLSNTVERLSSIGVNALESTATNLAVAGYYGQDSTMNKASMTMTVFNHGTMASLNRKQLANKGTKLEFLKEGLRTVRIGYKGSWALNAHLPLHEEAFYGREE
ncbi:RHS repeat-associated core domain-containing protein [Vibrio sp. YMD68]|uniref:RHS repeat-associated core domain-containing protein n=1 Tax=Vibrio sp. YMD68 TaxID=3042300 RepID=UPI00249A9F1E|nr:RHS repeat-associated core domain-containing protein [Vibrio sp. YMD68]WGV98276.1 RHS repeat-associated core domain-containing protein [Vibrio sp. YMD68]